VAGESPETLALARRFMDVCEKRKLGRNRKRYIIDDSALNRIFGSMRDVYIETLVCVFECGPDWMGDVCERYGVSRWKSDLESACQLLIAFKNTNGSWPESAWTNQATGFIMDFVNFLIIRGMPHRQVTETEIWRPVWVPVPNGGRVVTFAPRGGIKVAVPVALLDDDYIKLARLWVLKPRAHGTGPHHNEWTLLGKSVVFGDEIAIESMEDDKGHIKRGQKIFGRETQSPTVTSRRLRPKGLGLV
jgi:hypothetical protein